MPNRVGPTLNQGSVCYNNNDCDTRLIYTASSSSSTTPSLIEFTATNFAGSASFAPAQLSQWTTFTAAQKSAATPATLVNYLRGRVKFDTRSDNLITDTTTTPATVTDNRLYRKREATIGDAIESQPAFISKPVFIYPDSGYSTFIADHANRVGTIYMGSNDGAVHAITALEEGTSPNIVPGGTERWAYIPSMVWANLHKLADTNYALNHSNFVNGSPVIADIYCTAACPGGITPAWRTILVGGLNAGGRGYYALDITDPNLPMLLWEFTADKAGPYGDPDLGYSFGNPVITARSNDNRWVVMFTSGYDNTTGTNPGKGYLYVLDPVTGAALSKIGTGSGSSASPSGLSKIAAWNDVPSSNRATWVYGGDLDGNVWRFDITNPTTQPLLFATLNDPSGNPQPVTTAPVLGLINNKRTIFVATGKYLETADLSNTQVQSLYAIMDDRAPLSNPGGSPRNSTNLIQQFLTLDTTTGKRKSSNNAVDFSKIRGWYVDFPESGERVNIESKLLFGTLLVATLVPSNTVCSPGGHAWLNYFDYQTGGALDNSGFASSPYKSPIVGINDLAINGETLIEVTTDLIPTVNRDPPIKAQVGGFGSNRVLWREWNP
ncbi:MAG: PilC/PilY family type IV pilus protein [Gallionella sp.]